MKKHILSNALRITAIVLLFLVSLNALAAGYSFIVDPSGKGIGITTAYLRQSAPFRDYFIPGIVLFSVIGIGSSVIAVLAIIKQKQYCLLILMQGCILVGWIAVQLMMVTIFHPLHLIISSIGVILIVSGWTLRKSQTPMRTLVI